MVPQEIGTDTTPTVDVRMTLCSQCWWERVGWHTRVAVEEQM